MFAYAGVPVYVRVNIRHNWSYDLLHLVTEFTQLGRWRRRIAVRWTGRLCVSQILYVVMSKSRVPARPVIANVLFVFLIFTCQ